MAEMLGPDTLRVLEDALERDYGIKAGAWNGVPGGLNLRAHAKTWQVDLEAAEWKRAFDEGEVCGMRADTTDAENPHAAGGNRYSGWSFGFWHSRNRTDLGRPASRRD